MTFRARASLFFLIFGLIVVGSFTYGIYLYSKPAKQIASAPAAKSDSVEELLPRASELLKKKQTEQALITYRKVLSLHPKSLDGQLGLARGELLAGREDVAAREYERALELDSKNTTALLQLARIYSHQARTWPASELKFKQYSALQPADNEAQLGLARVLALEGKSREAARIFARPAVGKIMNVQDRENYASALIKSGQSHQAELVLKQLLAGGRQGSTLKLQLASIYASRRDWNSALPIYRSLLQERPNDPRLNLTYGLGLLAIKNYRVALDPLHKASTGLPSNGEAGLAYGRALKGAKDYNSAADEFDRVLPLFRGNAAVIREYADLLLEKKAYGKSEKYYRQALALGLRDARLLVGLSGALQGNRKPRQALPFLEEAYRLEPTNRLAFELAKLLQQVGRREQALALLDKIEVNSGRSLNK